MRFASIPTEDQSILDICYELAAELDAECRAEVINSKLCDGKGLSSDREVGDIEVTMRPEFSSPIYVGDIKDSI